MVIKQCMKLWMIKKAKESLIAMLKISAWFYINVTKDKSILPLKFKISKPTSKKVYKIDDYKKRSRKYRRK